MAEEDAVNDENDRRMSNGSAPPPASPITTTGGGGKGSSTGSPSLVTPVGTHLETPPGPSRSTHGSGGSSEWESSWDLSVCGTDKNSLASAGLDVRTPTAFCGATEPHAAGDDAGGVCDSNGRADKRASPVGSSSAAVPVANGATGGEGEGEGEGEGRKLASPAPGRRSKLFRRASLLPKESMSDLDNDEEDGDAKEDKGQENGGDDDAGRNKHGVGDCFGGDALEDSTDGGDGGSGSRGSRGDEESTDSSSIGRTGGLGVGGGGGGKPRVPGRRDAVLHEQRPQPRGRGSNKDCTPAAGRRGVGGSSSAAKGRSDASRSVAAKDRRRGKVDRPEGTMKGEGRSEKSRPRSKQRLYPKSGKGDGVLRKLFSFLFFKCCRGF